MYSKSVRFIFCTASSFRRIEKGVTTFRAEEMKFVIVALSEEIVVQRDKAGIDNGGFAVMTLMCEFLFVSQPEIFNSHHGNPSDNMPSLPTRMS